MEIYVLAHPMINDPAGVRSDILITSVRIEAGPGHDFLTVWNRGGNSGELTVNKGDGKTIARLLIPNGVWVPS